MTATSQYSPTTKQPHFATLLVMALAPAEVGARLAKARAAKGWTHERLADELAAFTGKKRPGLRTVQRWQKGVNPANGKSWLPRLDTLMDLADLLDVPRAYFVEDEDVQVTMGDLRSQLEALTEEVAGLRGDLKGRDEPSKPRAARRRAP